MGSNHSQSNQNGRAPVGASPVGFNYTPFGATSGRRCVKHGVAGEGLEGVRGEPFILEGFGCGDSVRVVGLGFHSLYGHQLPAEPTGYPMDSPENSGFDEVNRSIAVGGNMDAF